MVQQKAGRRFLGGVAHGGRNRYLCGRPRETSLMMPDSPTILVVDDEPQIVRLFDRILTAGGYIVHTAPSGALAMEVIHRDRVDLVILDLSMPEPDGFEILEILRSQRPDLKVLVISGFMHGALLRPAKFLGAAATLAKTEAPFKLLGMVQGLLQQ
jgi:CheY-like chemotaxis protein